MRGDVNNIKHTLRNIMGIIDVNSVIKATKSISTFGKTDRHFNP